MRHFDLTHSRSATTSRHRIPPTSPPVGAIAQPLSLAGAACVAVALGVGRGVTLCVGVVVLVGGGVRLDVAVGVGTNVGVGVLDAVGVKLAVTENVGVADAVAVAVAGMTAARHRPVATSHVSAPLLAS